MFHGFSRIDRLLAGLPLPTRFRRRLGLVPVLVPVPVAQRFPRRTSESRELAMR